MDWTTHGRLRIAEFDKPPGSPYNRLTSTVVSAKEEVFAVARYRLRHIISYVGALAAAAAEGSGAILVIGDEKLGLLAHQIQIEDLKQKQSTDQR